MPDVTTARMAAASALAGAIADKLASPSEVRNLRLAPRWLPQSLARGALGVALLHVERARAGVASWRRAHDWLACAGAGGVTAGDDSHLHHGAPALAFALQCAADGTGRYARALTGLDRHIAARTRRRLDLAYVRLNRGDPPALAEFDAIRGLTGIGALLLRRDPDGDLVRGVLAYLVRLTEPIEHQGESLPGWWTDSDPAGRLSGSFAGGHANHGMAHGIAGPLALLSLAARDGVTVAGQRPAIERICVWLDQWRQVSDAGPWWPYWVTRARNRGFRMDATEPLRPSWCYGTAGLARAQQLAALAMGDVARQRMAESALAGALSDPRQLAVTTDLSVCHGYAGLLHIAGRTAGDAISPPVGCVPRLLDAIVPDGADVERLSASLLRPPVDVGLLEGAAGIALALQGVGADRPPISGWDSCLLID